MVNYKKVLEKIVVFLKENKIIFLFGFLTAFVGILIIGNIVSNFAYFKDHRYFISLSNDFSSFFTVIKSIFYNNIIQGSAEALTSIFGMSVLYKNVNGLNMGTLNTKFNYILFFLSIFIFFITSISSYIIITINTKKQSLKNLFKELKTSYLKSFLLDFIRVIIFTVIFLLISLISYVFKLNSYFYMIVSFSISIVLFYFLYFIYNFSIRNILFLKQGIKTSIKSASYLLIKDFKNVFKGFCLMLLFMFLFMICIILVSLPFAFLNSYFISSGYTIFNTINSVFLSIINLLSVAVINIFIIRFLNDVYFESNKSIN